MSDIAEKELVFSIKEKRPVVLFLGQDAFSTQSNPDPVLSTWFHRFSINSEEKSGWKAFFEHKKINDEDMQWLTERFNRNVQPEAMQDILDLPWSAVFTSTIDSTLMRRLETRGRQPEAVLAKDYVALVPRSRSRPPVHFLYGIVDGPSLEFKSPRSKIQLKQRSSTHANNMLNRIAETVTPLGALVVEGLSPGRDWLEIDDFLAPLAEAKGLRILWFDAPLNPDSDFFDEFVDKGFIVPSNRRLVDVVSELGARKIFEDICSETSDEPGIISLTKDAFIDTTPSLRLRVEASAAIVDDSWTGAGTTPDGVIKEEAFRRFHGALGGPRTLVQGIDQGFAIKRDFEKQLRKQVEGVLRDQSNIGRIVILHGQSGTGKSIAFARLAKDFREELRMPVLYAVGRIPQATDLDDFCIEAEQAGALGTVILCDSNQEINRYQELSNALRSRGRRIVVVGTTYRTEARHEKSSVQLVESPTEVSEEERNALKKLVGTFEGKEASFLNAALDGEHVLALLYRIISASRERIIAGISSEARAVEQILRSRANSTPPQYAQFRSALATQLIKAGLHDGTVTLFENDERGAMFGTDAPSRLIDYVMSAGKLNCQVPVNLVIRALNKHQDSIDLVQISHLFGDLDLFRWRASDAEGKELLIAPRLQFEAELICRRRLNKDQELSCFTDLIEAVRPQGVDRSSEIQFVLDLLQKLNRSGPRGTTYGDGYLAIAQSLTTLRAKYNVQDASLMLQESSFRRAYLWWKDRQTVENNKLPEKERYQILNDAREIIETAILEINEGRIRAGRRTTDNLQVERASIYGFLAVGRARGHSSHDLIWGDYLAARTAITKARATVDNYFPSDIGLWTPIDIINSNVLELAQQAEVVSDFYNVLDQIDVNQLSPFQQEEYQKRRMTAANIIDDEIMGEDAYSSLKETNPPVAYFLKSRSIGAGIFEESTGTLPQDLREKARSAASFLKERMSEISADVKCLNLLLQFEWVAITGERLLRGDRHPAPSNIDNIANLRSIVSTLNHVSGDEARYVYRYLEATLEWLYGNTQRAIDLWKDLSNDTEYEDQSRVVRRLFVAKEDGKPIFYRGRVVAQRNETHWWVQVDDFPGKIALLSRDFKKEELQVGREVRNFAISFNFLGPIADPASRFGGQ